MSSSRATSPPCDSVGLLGAGNMGLALANGLRLRFPEMRLYACDAAPSAAARALPGLKLLDTVAELEEHCELIILAVKPNDLAGAVAALRGTRPCISIAAGVSTERLRSYFTGEAPALARVMPNLAATVLSGVSGIYCADDALYARVAAIFEAVGTVARVKSEDLLHAVTGLSGSGPAFVFAFIQALAEGGVLAGLTYETALELARGTVAGAARLLEAQPEHPAVWRNRVTSPGGTTIAGLAALEDAGFAGAVLRAVEAATERSRELGRG